MASTLWRYVRKVVWAITLAYMLALHNVYYGEQKSEDDIAFTIEEDARVDDAAPNN